MNDKTDNDILNDVYGAHAPDAARFGKGTRNRAGAQEAQDARRSAKPGEYDQRRNSESDAR